MRVAVRVCFALAGLAACREEAQGGGAPAAEDPGPRIASVRALVEAGDAKEAVARAETLVAGWPDSAQAQLVLASAYELDGRHAEALRAADAALAADPRSAGALVTRGAALGGLGRVDEAIEASREAVALAPDSRAALGNLAAFLGRSGDARGQAEVLGRLVALEPDDLDVREQRARSLAATGDAAGALAEGESIVRVDPTRAGVRLLMAAALLDLDRPEEAMDHADAAARLRPEDPAAVELFRAAFYVAVASRLSCAHGPRPWLDADIETELERYRRQGLRDASAFLAIDAAYGSRPEVRARIARAATRCRNAGGEAP
ncbi:MAG: tetratricopeptide repeat protein [Deltaproteobacteria bacterium]|nr:tetratricopeptide repeat protein [Deltaproteobacteria bacterium]MCB9785434.1 tetratricopeptide repeat protein [Deltaproteobacteria bacterium]